MVKAYGSSEVKGLRYLDTPEGGVCMPWARDPMHEAKIALVEDLRHHHSMNCHEHYALYSRNIAEDISFLLRVSAGSIYPSGKSEIHTQPH